MSRDGRPSGRAGTSDSRTAFQKDRDRVLYSLAFRRLATVTQVIGPLEGYIFHNRLTHSLEVAQIARRLAEKLVVDEPRASSDVAPDVVECAGLAHDLGHPPFGHAAEEELKEIASEHRLADGFEGNAQSFRIIVRLAELSPHLQNGLDLTWASLNATLKYPWDAATAAAKGTKKFGVYDDDVGIFRSARAIAPVVDEKTPEAQIMDVADDIAYSVHDVDDFYRAGLLPLDQLAADSTALMDFLVRWENDGGPKLGPAEIKQLQNLLNLARLRAPYSGTRAQRAGLRAFASDQIGGFVNAVSIARDRLLRWKVTVATDRELDIQFLKRLVWEFVITNPRLASLQAGQRRIVRELFETYLQAIQHQDLNLVPPLFREEAAAMGSGTSGPSTPEVRLAIDIVASLGDDQATQMARRLTGTDVGSVSDAFGL